MRHGYIAAASAAWGSRTDGYPDYQVDWSTKTLWRKLVEQAPALTGEGWHAERCLLDKKAC